MKEKIACPKCKAPEVIKNGKVQGKQRVKCKSCNYQFTRLIPPGRSGKEKAMAITLYTPGFSMHAIAKIFNVSPKAVLKWVKAFAKENYEKPKAGGAILIELDEMWHYLNSKKTKLGFGNISTRSWKAY